MLGGLKLYGMIAGIVALLGIVGYIYFKGYSNGKDDCRIAQAKAVIEGEKKREKIEREIDKLNDIDLRKRICFWMYDADYNTCIKTMPALR